MSVLRFQNPHSLRGTTYVVQDNQRLGPSTFSPADGVEKSIVVDRGNKLLNEESQEDSADGSKVEVVDHERTVELEGWTVTHQFPSTEDDNVVGHNHEPRLLQRGHWGNVRLEVEILGMVALHSREDLVEVRP